MVKKRLFGLLVLLVTTAFTLAACAGLVITSGTPVSSPSVTVTPASTGAWSGTWKVTGSWGDVVLTQNGNTITGTYAHEGGTVTGTVSGNVLTGTWTQTGNNRSGQFEFTMAPNEIEFTVKWKYQAESSWSNTNDRGSRK